MHTYIHTYIRKGKWEALLYQLINVEVITYTIIIDSSMIHQ